VVIYLFQIAYTESCEGDLCCGAAEISLTHTQPDRGIPPTASSTDPPQQPQDDTRQATPAVFSIGKTCVYMDGEGQRRSALDPMRGIVLGCVLSLVLFWLPLIGWLIP
jgi:hypothetical protein